MPCLDYRPDHNGECLNCDEWADQHPIIRLEGLRSQFALAGVSLADRQPWIDEITAVIALLRTGASQ